MAPVVGGRELSPTLGRPPATSELVWVGDLNLSIIHIKAKHLAVLKYDFSVGSRMPALRWPYAEASNRTYKSAAKNKNCTRVHLTATKIGRRKATVNKYSRRRSPRLLSSQKNQRAESDFLGVRNVSI